MNDILEDELSAIHWFQFKFLSLGKYLCAITDNNPIAAIALIAASLITAVVTLILTKNDSTRPDTVDGNQDDHPTFARNHLSGNVRHKSDDHAHTALRKRQGEL